MPPAGCPEETPSRGGSLGLELCFLQSESPCEAHVSRGPALLFPHSRGVAPSGSSRVHVAGTGTGARPRPPALDVLGPHAATSMCPRSALSPRTPEGREASPVSADLPLTRPPPFCARVSSLCDVQAIPRGPGGIAAAGGGCPWRSRFCPPRRFSTCCGRCTLEAFSAPDSSSRRPVPVSSVGDREGGVPCLPQPGYLRSSADPARPHPHVPSPRGRGRRHAHHPCTSLGPRQVSFLMLNPRATVAAARADSREARLGPGCTFLFWSEFRKQSGTFWEIEPMCWRERVAALSGDVLRGCRGHDLLVPLRRLPAGVHVPGGLPRGPLGSGGLCGGRERGLPEALAPCSRSCCRLAGCAQVGLGDKMLPFVLIVLELSLSGVLGVPATRRRRVRFFSAFVLLALVFVSCAGRDSRRTRQTGVPAQAPCGPRPLQDSFRCCSLSGGVSSSGERISGFWILTNVFFGTCQCDPGGPRP